MRGLLAAAVFVHCAAVGWAQELPANWAALHALNRLTFGPRPGDVEAIQKMGLGTWIDRQLHPERIPLNAELDGLTKVLVEPASPGRIDVFSKVAAQRDSLLSQSMTSEQSASLRNGSDQEALKVLATFSEETKVLVLAQMIAVRDRLLPLVDADLRKRVIGSAPAGVPQPGQTLAQAKLFRAIQSDRQLEEVLVDFWYNHFNVDAGKGAAWYMVTGYERDSIRPHVLGKFRELLGAVANSSAMMYYLDNWQSAAGKLNENYARELLELHTMGVNGGYTQADIVEIARCFTGWTIENPTTGGPFRYDDRAHDKGGKTVLGASIAAGGGKADGEKVLDIVARHPSTARFISRKLVQRFVADDAPPALVDRMAAVFHDTDGDIRAVLTALFASEEFLSEGAYRSKLKTPFEMVVSAVRATGATVDNAAALARQVALLGEPLYRKLEPTGYSTVEKDWASSAGLMARMNFAMDLAQNRVAGVQVDSGRFWADPATGARQILFVEPQPQTRAAIAQALSGSPANPSALVAGMALGSPDFQRR